MCIIIIVTAAASALISNNGYVSCLKESDIGYCLLCILLHSYQSLNPIHLAGSCISILNNTFSK